MPIYNDIQAHKQQRARERVEVPVRSRENMHKMSNSSFANEWSRKKEGSLWGNLHRQLIVLSNLFARAWWVTKGRTHIETVISCWTWFKLDDILNCCASDFWYNIDTLLTCCHTVVLFENLTLIYPLDKHESQARDRVEKDVYLGPQTCVYLKNDLVVLPLHIKILTSMYDMRRFKSSASCSVTMWPS